MFGFFFPPRPFINFVLKLLLKFIYVFSVYIFTSDFLTYEESASLEAWDACIPFENLLSENECSQFIIITSQVTANFLPCSQ